MLAHQVPTYIGGNASIHLTVHEQQAVLTPEYGTPLPQDNNMSDESGRKICRNMRATNEAWRILVPAARFFGLGRR